MTYALDSNIISYMLKNDLAIYEKFRQAEASGHNFVIPAIVYYEVKRGLLAMRLNNRLAAFEKLSERLYHGNFNQLVWERAAQIYAMLRCQGNLIDDADLFIAAFCVVNDYTLITNNESHFTRIKELKLINWKS